MPKYVKIIKSNPMLNINCSFSYLDKYISIMTWKVKFKLSDSDFWLDEKLTHTLAHLLLSFLPPFCTTRGLVSRVRTA